LVFASATLLLVCQLASFGWHTLWAGLAPGYPDAASTSAPVARRTPPRSHRFHASDRVPQPATHLMPATASGHMRPIPRLNCIPPVPSCQARRAPPLATVPSPAALSQPRPFPVLMSHLLCNIPDETLATYVRNS
jgi:hypothetical protein